MINVRTDLALEAREIYKKSNNLNSEIEGIEVIKNEKEGINVTLVKVVNETGAKNIGKPVGNYITIDIPHFTAYDSETMEKVSHTLFESLKEMVCYLLCII